MKRIDEIKREGLWYEKRIKKVKENKRVKENWE